MAVWGGNGGAPGLYPPTPTNVNGVVAISAGATHSLVLKVDGSLVAWGENCCGQASVPPNLTGVTAIAAGGHNTAALYTPSPLSITTSPISQTVDQWGSVRFAVGATGFPLTYQWRKDGTNISGETNRTYNATTAGAYSVIVMDVLVAQAKRLPCSKRQILILKI